MVRLRSLGTIACLVLAAVGAARAEDLVWATGRVVGASGQPLASAVVAVYDDKNRVIDYTRTDDNGEYALAVPRRALHLGKPAGGALHRVVQAVGGVGRVVALPLKAGIRAAAGASTVSDPVTKASLGAASTVAQALVDAISPGDRKRVEDLRRAPGAIVMKVVAPGHNDAVSIARCYWLEEEVYRAGGKQQSALAAWMDPATLTRDGVEEPSAIKSEFLTLRNPRLEPSIAEPGDTVFISARMTLPRDPRTPVVVVARNDRTGEIVELLPVGGDLYRAELRIGKDAPRNDQVYSIVAYAEQADEPGRNKKSEAALMKSGQWNPRKPYLYHPLGAVSRNRADVTLTVVGEPRR